MEILSIPIHGIFDFFGDRVEVLENGVGGGLERSRCLHHHCPSVIDWMGGDNQFLAVSPL